MNRRNFIRLVGGTALWPLTARAQQASMPVIGLLSSVPFETRKDQLLGFKRGLKEAGYVEGQNVRIEYRATDNQLDLLPELAADLVSRKVDVIVTIGGDISIQAAKAATATIPVVFVTGFDPVGAGFVDSINRPGRNLTGVSFLVVFTTGKRLELLSEVVPAASRIGTLVNPANPNVDANIQEARTASEKLGKNIVVAKAGRMGELNSAFDTFSAQKVQALLVEADPYFLAQRQQIVALAERHSLPAIYAFREFVPIGGLISYGTSLASAYQQAAGYAARILKGGKASELPVLQATSFELVINLRTAKALGLNVPATLQAAADEVIE